MNSEENSIRRYALFSATLSSFLTPFAASSVNIAIPIIGKQLNSSAITLPWISTSYLLASAVLLVPFGRMADIYGRKKFFLVGMVIDAVSSLICGLTNSIELLLIFRVFQGVGGAMIFGTGIAILTSVFPPGERGRVLGINVAAVYIGLSAGPFFGGFLTHNLGWASIFFLMAILEIIISVLIALKLKGEWAGAKGEKFDIIGSLLYGSAVFLVVYGVSTWKNNQFARWLLLPGAIFVIAFIITEMKVGSPVLNLKLFSSNVTFTFSNLAAFLNYSATAGAGFLLSLYLQVARGLSPQTTGLILFFQPLTQALLSPTAGRFSDKVEPRIVASFGMGLIAVGLFAFSLLKSDTHFQLVIANLILLGIGFALFSSPNTNAVMSSVEKKYYGVASAIISTMRLIGQTFSMSIVTLLFSIYMGKKNLTPEIAPMLIKNMKIAFATFAALCLLGVFASLARGRVRKRNG
jgi:EmrB/QacA subfamily drug resistance transporter